MIRVKVLTNIPYPWFVVALLVVSISSSAIIYMGFGVLFPFIQEDLELSRAQLGLISSGMFLGGTASVLFLGWLVDVVGVKQLQVWSLIGVVISLLLFSQMQSLLQGILIAVLLGIASSSALPSETKAIIDWLPPRSRALAMGIIECSIPIYGIIAALVFTVLAINFGWREAIFSLAVLTAITCAVFFIFYRDKTADSSEREKRPLPQGRVTRAIKNKDLWLVACFGAALAGVWAAMVSYLVLFLKEEMGESAGVAGGLFSVVLAGATVGRIFWGVISDVVLHRRRAATIAIIGILSVGIIALLASLPSDTNVVLLGLVLFFLGGITLSWTGLWPILIADLVGPDLTGTAMGFASMTQRIISFGIAPLFGWIVDSTDSYALGWWMAAGLAALGTLGLAFLKPEARLR